MTATVYRPRSATLSPQQTRIAKLYIQGDTAEEIGQKLGLTTWTIRSYLKRVRKYCEHRGHDVHNVIQLRKALRTLGLLDDIEKI